jgi:acyl-CoA reductase-like NAD-dependent aldehyde dehydrogenase
VERDHGPPAEGAAIFHTAYIVLDDADMDQIDSAVKGGATVLLGGKRVDRQGYFLEPTILSNVTPENPMFHQEFFAPVAMIFPVKNDDEAVKLANDSPYGLGGSIADLPLEAPLRVLDLVDRYHATAEALVECGRLVRTLEIQRYWGDYAL